MRQYAIRRHASRRTAAEQDSLENGASDGDLNEAHLTTTSAPRERLDPALLRIAGVVLFGAVAALLDTTIISVALDQLGQELGASFSTVQWVSTAYLLAMALVIPLTGACVDRFGAKTTWLWVLALFLAGSMLCGAAWSVGSLIAFRVVQGLGAGMILPLTQIIVARAAGPRRIGRVMALVAIPGNLVPILGPVLGGFILDGLQWRWIFFINVPVCVLALVLAWRGLPEDPPRTPQPVDLLGLALLLPGVVSMVYGLSRAGEESSFAASGILAPIAIGFTLLAAFVVHALNTRMTPIIDLRLFRQRSFSASAGLMFLFGVSLYGPMLLLPFYYQQVRGLDALTTGLMLAPQGIGTALALVVLGPLSDRIGVRRLAVVGALVTIAGTFAFTQIRADPNDVLLGASLLLRGAGLAAVGIPMMAAVYHRLPHSAIPRATSATNVIQRIGASFGTAVTAVILQQQIGHPAISGFAGEALVAGYANTFWWTFGFATLALIPIAFLPRGVR